MKDTTGLLSVLPLLSFLIGIVVAIIQLYVSSKQAKLKEQMEEYVDNGINKLEARLMTLINDKFRVNDDFHAKVVTKESLDYIVQLTKEQLKNEMRKN